MKHPKKVTKIVLASFLLTLSPMPGISGSAQAANGRNTTAILAGLAGLAAGSLATYFIMRSRDERRVARAREATQQLDRSTPSQEQLSQGTCDQPQLDTAIEQCRAEERNTRNLSPIDIAPGVGQDQQPVLRRIQEQSEPMIQQYRRSSAPTAAACADRIEQRRSCAGQLRENLRRPGSQARGRQRGETGTRQEGQTPPAAPPAPAPAPAPAGATEGATSSPEGTPSPQTPPEPGT